MCVFDVGAWTEDFFFHIVGQTPVAGLQQRGRTGQKAGWDADGDLMGINT